MLPYTICASYTGIMSAARNRPEHRPRKGRGEPSEAASASSHTLSFLRHPNAGNLATGSRVFRSDHELAALHLTTRGLTRDIQLAICTAAPPCCRDRAVGAR